MLEQGAGPAETKGFWAQAAADGGVAAGLPALPAGEAQEGAVLSSHAHQQHHGQRWQQQVTGGGAPFLSVTGNHNVIIITGLAAQHLVTHQPVQLETASGKEAASLLYQAQQQQQEEGAAAGAGQEQQADGQGAAGAAVGARWQAWGAGLAAAHEAGAAAAAGKRKSPEPGVAEAAAEEDAPAAKATRTSGRGGRGKAGAA